MPNDAFSLYIPEWNVSHYQRDHPDTLLFEAHHSTDAYTLALPIIASLGIIFNITTFILLLYPDFRGLSTLFLKANLLSDSVYLFSIMLSLMPLATLHDKYLDGKYEEFWSTFNRVSSIAVFMYPVSCITRLTSQWYTLAFVAEQFAAFYHPESLVKFSMGDSGSKVAIVILNISIIVHMISFFTYIRKKVIIWQDINGIFKFPVMESCLSGIFRDDNYQNFEKYIYIVFFELIPWIVMLVYFIACAQAYYTLKKESEDIEDIGDSKLVLRTMRSGRCVATVLSITSVSLILYMVYYTMNMIITPYLHFDKDSEVCHLLTVDWRYTSQEASLDVRLTYLFAVVLNSCVKPWICVIVNSDFRGLITSCCSRTAKNVQEISRRIYMITDFARPGPPPEPTNLDPMDPDQDFEMVQYDNAHTDLTNGAAVYYDTISVSTISPENTPQSTHRIIL